MRAFIVTLDAMLAVILVGLMASSALILVRDSENMDWKEIYIQRMLDDALATIDEAGLVTSTVDKGNIKDMLDLLPERVCSRIKFYLKGSSSAYKTVSRRGCGSPSGRVSVARRQFLYYDSGSLDKWTIAVAEGWYK